MTDQPGQRVDSHRQSAGSDSDMGIFYPHYINHQRHSEDGPTPANQSKREADNDATEQFNRDMHCSG